MKNSCFCLYAISSNVSYVFIQAQGLLNLTKANKMESNENK